MRVAILLAKRIHAIAICAFAAACNRLVQRCCASWFATCDLRLVSWTALWADGTILAWSGRRREAERQARKEEACRAEDVKYRKRPAGEVATQAQSYVRSSPV